MCMIKATVSQQQYWQALQVKRTQCNVTDASGSMACTRATHPEDHQQATLLQSWRPPPTNKHAAHLSEMVLPDSHLNICRSKCCTTYPQCTLTHALSLAVLAAAAQQLYLQLQDWQQLSTAAAKQLLLQSQTSKQMQ